MSSKFFKYLFCIGCFFVAMAPTCWMIGIWTAGEFSTNMWASGFVIGLIGAGCIALSAGGLDA